MTDAGNVQTNTNKHKQTQTNTLFIKGEIQNGPQQKQNTHTKKKTKIILILPIITLPTIIKIKRSY